MKPEDPASLHHLRRHGGPVAKSDFLRLFASPDIELIVAAYRALLEIWERIQPKLTRAEYGDILIKTFAKVLQEAREPAQSTIPSPYEIARVLTNWCMTETDAGLENQQTLASMATVRDSLGRLYLEGNEELRTTIVTGVLEHIFEREAIRAFFLPWKDHPLLRLAFEEADSWAQALRRARRLLREVALRCADALRSGSARDVRITDAPIGASAVTITWTEGNMERELDIDLKGDVGDVEAVLKNPAIMDRLVKEALDGGKEAPSPSSSEQKTILLSVQEQETA